jgi:hypothetical protein
MSISIQTQMLQCIVVWTERLPRHEPKIIHQNTVKEIYAQYFHSTVGVEKRLHAILPVDCVIRPFFRENFDP